MDGLYQGPEGLCLRFFEEAAKNEYQSERAGKPTYDSVLFVEMISPGSKESSPVAELERRFCPESGITEPRRTAQYERFKAQVEAYRSSTEASDLMGTPLTIWPQVDVATVASLKEGRIYTVEALAALPDEKLRLVPGNGRTLREQAKAYLEAAANGAGMGALVAENEAMRNELTNINTRAAEMAAQNKELMDRLSALEGKPVAQPTPATVGEAVVPAKAGAKLKDII